MPIQKATFDSWRFSCVYKKLIVLFSSSSVNTDNCTCHGYCEAQMEKLGVERAVVQLDTSYVLLLDVRMERSVWLQCCLGQTATLPDDESNQNSHCLCMAELRKIHKYSITGCVVVILHNFFVAWICIAWCL